MGAETGGDPGNRQLKTWKEIAGFFGCDERTVKRWESERGLPVRRLPNGSRSTVYAYERELKAWLARSETAELKSSEMAAPIAPARLARIRWSRRGYALAVIAGILCAVAGATFLLFFNDRSTLRDHAAPVVQTASRTPNAEAVSFYRAGLHEWQTRTPAGLTHAVDDFTQAIVHDPLYAEAYAGLANAYNLLREFSTMPPEESYPRAKAAAEQAIALDPSLGDAHAALAFVDFYWSRDPQAARREFLKAIALEPRNATAHHWYATFLMTIGESAPALAEINKAEALDSESTAILADKGLILFYAGRPDEAAALLQRIEQTEPRFYSTHGYLATVDVARDDDAGFVREMAAAAAMRNDQPGAAIAAAAARGRSAGGRDAMFAAMLGEQKQLYAEGQGTAYALAQSFAQLGDGKDAMANLELSLSRHESQIIELAIDPSFARWRRTGEFRALMARAGLPVRS
jgi:Tfp pilus assembly protein PilF